MAFPNQERYTIEDISKKWKTTIGYVEDLVRRMMMSHVIVEGGSPRIRQHFYFDLNLWKEQFGDKLKNACALARRELNDLIEGFKREWAETGRKFDPSHLLKKHEQWCGPTHYQISEKEIAYLILPPTQMDWPPLEGTIYIPCSAVADFEKKHDIQRVSADDKPAMAMQAWIKSARAIGLRLVQKHRGLSGLRLAEKVRNEMIEREQKGETDMTGRSGCVPSAESIRRHALTKIKSSR